MMTAFLQMHRYTRTGPQETREGKNPPISVRGMDNWTEYTPHQGDNKNYIRGTEYVVGIEGLKTRIVASYPPLLILGQKTDFRQM